jgi:hypothetical protein
VYQHFTMLLSIDLTEKGKVQYTFSCKKYIFLSSDSLNLLIIFYFRHPSIIIKHVQHKNSTSNLACHIKTCSPANTEGAQKMKTYSQGSTYTKAQHQLKIALWIACHHHPFMIVEDSKLFDIFKSFNTACITSQYNTVSCA